MAGAVLVRNDGSGFTSSAQAQCCSSTMCWFDVQAEPVPGTPAMGAACPWCMLCPGNTARECCCSFNCNLGEDLYFYSWTTLQKNPVCPGNLSSPSLTINMPLQIEEGV